MFNPDFARVNDHQNLDLIIRTYQAGLINGDEARKALAVDIEKTETPPNPTKKVVGDILERLKTGKGFTNEEAVHAGPSYVRGYHDSAKDIINYITGVRASL